MELLAAHPTRYPLLPNGLENSLNVRGAAMHVALGIIADHESPAAVTLGVTRDRPNIDDENIVFSQSYIRLRGIDIILDGVGSEAHEGPVHPSLEPS